MGICYCETGGEDGHAWGTGDCPSPDCVCLTCSWGGWRGDLHWRRDGPRAETAVLRLLQDPPVETPVCPRCGSPDVTEVPMP